MILPFNPELDYLLTVLWVRVMARKKSADSVETLVERIFCSAQCIGSTTGKCCAVMASFRAMALPARYRARSNVELYDVRVPLAQLPNTPYAICIATKRSIGEK